MQQNGFVTEHCGTQVDDAMATWNGCGVRIKTWHEGDVYMQFSSDQITSSTSHIWFVSFSININYINHLHRLLVMKNWVSPFADHWIMWIGTRFRKTDGLEILKGIHILFNSEICVICVKIYSRLYFILVTCQYSLRNYVSTTQY